MCVYVCIHTYIYIYIYIYVDLEDLAQPLGDLSFQRAGLGQPSSWDDCPTVETSGSDSCVLAGFAPKEKGHV